MAKYTAQKNVFAFIWEYRVLFDEFLYKIYFYVEDREEKKRRRQLDWHTMETDWFERCAGMWQYLHVLYPELAAFLYHSTTVIHYINPPTEDPQLVIAVNHVDY